KEPRMAVARSSAPDPALGDDASPVLVYARAMRTRTLLPVAAMLLLLSAPAFAKRDKIDCSKVSMTKLEPGWGNLPAALQKLPRGATLCGHAQGGETVFITSALDRDALEKFYAPLFASLGCKLT